MQLKRRLNFKIYLRAITAVLLFITWGLSTFSGILLYLAPSGSRSGQAILFLGFTKSTWGDIHFWISVAAIVVTIIHIIVDWKVLRSVIRYMASTHRGQIPTVEK
jgi:hypothetical protein